MRRLMYSKGKPKDQKKSQRVQLVVCVCSEVVSSMCVNVKVCACVCTLWDGSLWITASLCDVYSADSD